MIYYNNYANLKKDDDNHSRNVFLSKKKGCVDEINSSNAKLFNGKNFKNKTSIYS